MVQSELEEVTAEIAAIKERLVREKEKLSPDQVHALNRKLVELIQRKLQIQREQADLID